MRDNMKGGALTEVTFYILLSLYAPKHGYAVMQFIEEKTGGRLSLGAGTLYGALNSLQEKKWIKPCGDCEGRKKEYIISELQAELPDKWEYYIDRLSGYIASTGRKYKNHAATIRRWVADDTAKAAPKRGIPDYSYKEGESL